MTYEEKVLGLKFIQIMYWFVIVSLIATIGIQVFIGFNGLVWYVFIPVWALANFGLRILKRYFRN